MTGFNENKLINTYKSYYLETKLNKDNKEKRIETAQILEQKQPKSNNTKIKTKYPNRKVNYLKLTHNNNNENKTEITFRNTITTCNNNSTTTAPTNTNAKVVKKTVINESEIKLLNIKHNDLGIHCQTEQISTANRFESHENNKIKILKVNTCKPKEITTSNNNINLIGNKNSTHNNQTEAINLTEFFNEYYNNKS